MQPVNLSFYCEFLYKVWCHVTCKHQWTSMQTFMQSFIWTSVQTFIRTSSQTCIPTSFHAKFHLNFCANFHSNFIANLHSNFLSCKVLFELPCKLSCKFHVNFHAANLHVFTHANFQAWRDPLSIKFTTEPVISTRSSKLRVTIFTYVHNCH